MRLTAKEFLALEHQAITFLGMSGVGKTLVSRRLDPKRWFNYSGDYRIGTRYLDEEIMDNLKSYMMTLPFLAERLRQDSFYIVSNLTTQNLDLTTSFLGKPGNSEAGGLPLDVFKRRLKLHHDAEVHAMDDVPRFIRKAQNIYQYPHFVNDAGGSLCELQDPSVHARLAQHTLILYIHADSAHVDELCARQRRDPKPLYYPEPFLDQALHDYKKEKGIKFEDMDPDDFTCWAFPRLLQDRLERYRKIADKFGYTIDMTEFQNVQNADDLVDLIAQSIDRA